MQRPNLHLKERTERVVNRLDPGSDWRAWSRLGAWFFALVSLIPLLGIALSNTASGEFFATTVDGARHTIWGLNYDNSFGPALLWSEIILISAAIVGTLLPIRKARRWGHGLLIAWAGLWTLGAWQLATISPTGWGLQAIVMTALCGCTIHRAMSGRRTRYTPSVAPTPKKVAPAIEPPHASPRDEHHEADEQLNRARLFVQQGVETARSMVRNSAPAAKKAAVKVADASKAGYRAFRDQFKSRPQTSTQTEAV